MMSAVEQRVIYFYIVHNMLCILTDYEKATVNLICKMKVLVAQLFLTLFDPMDCSPPGSSVHGISQARILEWVAIPFSRGSSQPRDRTHVSCVSRIAGRFFTV